MYAYMYIRKWNGIKWTLLVCDRFSVHTMLVRYLFQGPFNSYLISIFLKQLIIHRNGSRTFLVHTVHTIIHIYIHQYNLHI